MIFISLVIVIIAGFLYYYSTHTFNVWRDKNITGPKPIPFFGNLKESALRRKHIGMIYKEIYDEFPDETVIGIYRMTNPALIIRDLDVIKQILIKDFDVFSDRGVEFSKEGLGDNLFHCDKTTWQGLRRHLTPLFSSGKLKSTFPLIEHHADELVKSLQAAIFLEPEQELHQYFRKYTMATIMGGLFGLNVDFFNVEQKAIEKAGEYIFTSTYAAEMDMLFPNILKHLNMSLYPYLVNKFCYNVVHTVNSQRDSINSIRNDVMDVLRALKKEGEIREVNGDDAKMQVILGVTEHVIAAQVFILFAAGFGNNALGMSYALFRLAHDQEVQHKLIKEIDEVLEKYDGKLTYDALKEMTYLDKVLCEVLRMNPVPHAILRSAKENYVIPGTDLKIDKGTTVIISPYAIHRDEKLYPDPDKFDPERFSSESSANRHPCSYLPFGAGPRSCIGRQLAKIQFCVGMVKVLSKFRVEPSEKTKVIEDYDPMSTLLATKGGVYVKFVPRG